MGFSMYRVFDLRRFPTCDEGVSVDGTLRQLVLPQETVFSARKPSQLPLSYPYPLCTSLSAGAGFDLVEESPPGVVVGHVVRPHDACHGLVAHPHVRRWGRANWKVCYILVLWQSCRKPGRHDQCPRTMQQQYSKHAKHHRNKRAYDWCTISSMRSRFEARGPRVMQQQPQ